MMSRMHRTDGFALPITIFVVTLVTIMLAAVFVRVQADRRIGESSGDIVAALPVAQSGLDTYLGTLNLDACFRPIRPPDGDSVRINVQGGYADVVAHVVQQPLDTLATWMYIVRSTGRVIEPTQGADPQAVRTVAQFAQWQRGDIDVLAAFTAANGLSRTAGGTGALQGNDTAPSPCNDPNVPALRVPNGEAPDLTDYTTNGTNPNVVASDNGTTVANQTNIDWLATITGGVIPDYTYARVNDPAYPVSLVTGGGHATVGTAGVTTLGYGTLIVTDHLTVQGDLFMWMGIVLVGGHIHFDADLHYFYGTVISGLNEQMGFNELTRDIGGDYLSIDYDSRYVRLATRAFAGFVPITNGWVDNWASY